MQTTGISAAFTPFTTLHTVCAVKEMREGTQVTAKIEANNTCKVREAALPLLPRGARPCRIVKTAARIPDT